MEFHNEDIMILAKTKPTPSKNNGALICTAGINSNGEWRRLYPIRWDTFFRKNINEFGDEEGKARTAETIWSLYSKRDMYFVLGNSWDYYRWPKKWFIIGLIHVPRNCVNTWEW